MLHLSNRRRKEIASLTKKKYRERLGQCLVEGVRSVEAALDAGAPLVELLVADGIEADPRAASVVRRFDGPTYVVPAPHLAALSDVDTPQGLLAVAQLTPTPVADLAACRAVLALDGVQDPGNVGTLLRTAAWFGADAVLAGPGTADVYGPKVVRAAMGGLWDVRLARADDLTASLGVLQARGFTAYGADLDGDDARRWTPAAPSVLVLGSEAHGLSDAVRAQLDARVRLAGQAGRAGAESLNVAVAGGILLYEWLAR